jgi:CBS domain-containing protein
MFSAKHIMNSRVLTIGPEDTVDDAIGLMVDQQVAGLPVVDENGNLVGTVTNRDLLELVMDCWAAKDRVADYMSPDACRVDKDDHWIKVADLLRSTDLRTVPVTDAGQLVGTVSCDDLLRAIRNARRLVRDVLAQQA